MLKREEFFMIRNLKSKGLSITKIAEIVDLDRKTVSKWLDSHELPQYRKRESGTSKLDGYHDYILKRMNEGCLNAVVILDEIIDQGYSGKVTILRDFMKQHRETLSQLASIRFETHPGEQAQVDWGEFKYEVEPNVYKRIHAFVMVMGYSRKMFVEFTEDEKIETLIGCHERALRYFGGVPETILYDNMRTVVKHVNQTGENRWNDTFLRFAEYQQFQPIRCRPYNPRGKGKVENGVKFVRRNFWPRIQQFHSLADLNEQALNWLDTKCNTRVHKTTLKIPAIAILEENLRPFNPDPFFKAGIASRKVMNDCMVQYESNLYSVPHKFVGKRVSIKDLRNGLIEIFDDSGRFITSFEKLEGKHLVAKNKKHFEGIHSRNQLVKASRAVTMVPKHSVKVYQRPLEVYDSLVSEVTE